MKQTISRRTFLKLSGATVATVAIANQIPKSILHAEGKITKRNVNKVRTICEMCSVRCPMEVSVENDKISYVGGNPDWSSTGGTICARGAASLSQVYDDQRVKKPLIRQGKRGENKWKEVSWDEAYDYIAEKMQQIKTKYGPEAMAFSSRSGFHKNYMDTFASAYGSPNTFTHDSTCPMARAVAQSITLGGGVSIDYGNVKYLISLGRNYFEAINTAHARAVMKAMKNGAKLISMDPRFSVTSSKADEWYAIKPGTDLAVVLAITHVIVRDKTYDKNFIDTYTVGFDEIVASVKDTTPEWAEKESGVPAKDIERIAKEFAAAKQRAVIDWGWRTATSPEEIELRRASINATMLVGAFEVPGGMYRVKNASLVNDIIGKEVIPKIKSPKLPAFPKPKRQRVDGAGVKGDPNQFISPKNGVVHILPEAILTDKPYPIKGWFVYRNNPMISQSNTNRLIEALQKIDLLVVCDIHMSDTANLADVVLPESTFLERSEGFNDGSGGSPRYTIREQVVAPIYDTKPNWQIFKELAEKMQLGAYFPWKDINELRLIQMGGNQELVKQALAKGFLDFGEKSLFLLDKKSVAAFVKKHPEAAAKVNEAGVIPGPVLNLKTPSKKIELASAQVEKAFVGRGVPRYRSVKLKEDNELYFLQGKVAVHTNAHTHNVPWLNDLMPENSLWINPDTAAKQGLKHGDNVEITSQYGKQPARILLSEGIRPDSVFTYFGFGRVSPGMKRAHNRGTNSNIMLPTVFSPVCAMSLHTVGIQIKKK